MISSDTDTMRHITTVILDLDDTLWDLPLVISHAEQVIYAWFSEEYPRINERFSIADLRRLRENIALEHPTQDHDLIFLREQTYRRLAQMCGYDESLYAEAVAVFQRARNEVTLYTDVEPALRSLSGSHRLLALTNGNADLSAIGLEVFFDGIYTARDLGCAKPDPKVFLAVCKHAGVEPGEVLHVGDDPRNDVDAPRAMGMAAVWVNRRDRVWPADLELPVHEISDLTPLAVMLNS